MAKVKLMHWQAIHHDGRVVTGPDGFHDLDFETVRHFSIVQPLEIPRGSKLQANHLCVWEANAVPLDYEKRSTPNEIFHVIEMPKVKVFVFEGTCDVITQKDWGAGSFGPIKK